MSKSIGNVTDPIQAINEYGLDVVRWYLTRIGGRWRSDVGESGYMVNCFSNIHIQLHQIGLNLNLKSIAMKFNLCLATTFCVSLLPNSYSVLSQLIPSRLMKSRKHTKVSLARLWFNSSPFNVKRQREPERKCRIWRFQRRCVIWLN